jgi:hypothetical protein
MEAAQKDEAAFLIEPLSLQSAVATAGKTTLEFKCIQFIYT